MAKLPGTGAITNVASLGRHDVSGPAKKVSAKIMAAGQITEGFHDVEKIMAASEYTKNIGDAKTSITDLFDTVVSKNMFTLDEIPDYVDINRFEKGLDDEGNIIDIEREFIPAYEVSEKWFKAGAKNISQTVSGNTQTGIARDRLRLEINGSIVPAAYANLVSHNRKIMREDKLAEMDYAVQANIVAGDRVGMETTLTRFLASGLISKEDYRVRQLQASQDLDIEEYSKSIAMSESAWELDDIESDLDNNKSVTTPGNVESDMTYAQRQSLRVAISAQRTAAEKVRRERHSDTAQAMTGAAINGDLTHRDIARAVINDELDDPTARALENMITDNASSLSSSIVRSAVVAEHKNSIQASIYFPTFGDQASNVTQNVKSNIIRNTSLNGAEKEILLTYADKVESDLRGVPEFKTAIRNIRASVGLPEGQEAYDNLSINFMTPIQKIGMKANADFQQALFNYIDEFGLEANVLEFVDKNKAVYDYQSEPDEVDRKWTQLKTSPYSGYSPKVPGEANPDIIIKRAYDDWTLGKRTDEELFDIWNIMYGDAIDVAFLRGL